MSDEYPRYIDVVDVAKLVRVALKENFPDIRFSVRSSRYAGGASVVVNWKAGPQQADVMTVVGEYAGACLDGDYSPRPVLHYLRPGGGGDGGIQPGVIGYWGL